MGVTHTMSIMNQVMLLVQLFLLSMVKSSGATRDGCDGFYRQGVESYLNCQIYLMKWTVAAYWLIAIGVLIFAFTKLFTLLRSCCRTSSRKPARDGNLA